MKFLIVLGLGLISTSALAQKNLNTFNPELSVNTLFSYKQSQNDIDEDGFNLDEVELGFAADVDAYYRARVTLGIHPKHAHHEEEEEAESAEHEEEEDSHGYALDVEEAYLETLAIPSASFIIGKSYAALGKHNTLHKHAFPFIDAPLINTELFGDEGLNESGIGLNYLIPLPWYSELSVSHVSGKNEKLFAGTNRGKGAAISHFKNLFDLSDDSTIELGLSYAKGKNSASGQTIISAADFTYKWKASKSSAHRSFIYGLEYMKMEKDLKTSEENQSGVSSHFIYQFGRRWFGQYRYDYIGLDKKDTKKSQRHTALVSFKTSEFSSIRSQYEVVNSKESNEEKRLSLQLNISFGAHPAHAY